MYDYGKIHEDSQFRKPIVESVAMRNNTGTAPKGKVEKVVIQSSKVNKYINPGSGGVKNV